MCHVSGPYIVYLRHRHKLFKNCIQAQLDVAGHENVPIEAKCLILKDFLHLPTATFCFTCGDSISCKSVILKAFLTWHEPCI